MVCFKTHLQIIGTDKTKVSVKLRPPYLIGKEKSKEQSTAEKEFTEKI